MEPDHTKQGFKSDKHKQDYLRNCKCKSCVAHRTPDVPTPKPDTPIDVYRKFFPHWVR